MVRKILNTLYLWEWGRKIRISESPFVITLASLVMPNGNHLDGFFYPIFALMIESYINRLFAYCKGGNFNINIWAWFDYFIC